MKLHQPRLVQVENVQPPYLSTIRIQLHSQLHRTNCFRPPMMAAIRQDLVDSAVRISCGRTGGSSANTTFRSPVRFFDGKPLEVLLELTLKSPVLQDPSVANAPLDKRIAFLQSKNLTQDEIDASLAQAGGVSQASLSNNYGYPQQVARQPPPGQSGYGPYPPGGFWQQPPPESALSL